MVADGCIYTEERNNEAKRVCSDINFSQVEVDLDKAYRICKSILHKPMIKSKITVKNHLYAKDIPTFLNELIELGLVEKVVLPAKCASGGMGLVIISSGNRKQYGYNYFRTTWKGLESLKEVDRNGGADFKCPRW
jgi:hypothetical protein